MAKTKRIGDIMGNAISNEVTEYDNRADGYEVFSAIIHGAVTISVVNSLNKKIFKTNAEGLFDAYLANLPEDARQHYNCNTCKKFINKFGGLVCINEADGKTSSVLWRDDRSNAAKMPSFFAQSVAAMRKIVEKSKVTGVFTSDTQIVGTPVTGEWHHLHAFIPKSIMNKEVIHSASQVMHEKQQDFIMLSRALASFDERTCVVATELLKNLYRGDKTYEQAKWLCEVYAFRRNKNLLWNKVASAPKGWCHVKSSMIGSLLSDIEEGMSIDAVTSRFEKKMDPLQYMRPQKAADHGNIEQAEKVVASLGIQDSLARRFAKLEEIETIWTPNEKEKQETPDGVFGSLKKKKIQVLGSPKVVNITWEKFEREVLHGAQEMEYFCGSPVDNFAAILTAVNKDAPCIFRHGNHFSTYLYARGSSSRQWGLDSSAKVNAVGYRPSAWDKSQASEKDGILLVLEGARDTAYDTAGLGLFPESLIGELHSVRKTIESFSQDGELEGYDDATACGVIISNGGMPPSAKLKVTTNGVSVCYHIDRLS